MGQQSLKNDQCPDCLRMHLSKQEKKFTYNNDKCIECLKKEYLISNHYTS